MPEAILDPDLPIVDPHHHLWDRSMAALAAPVHPFDHVVRKNARYLLDELMKDTGSGHNVTHTVFIDCRAFYRTEGPPELRSLGETEFVEGVAEASAKAGGPTRACAAIVSNVDLLTVGDRAGEILDKHLQISARFRGIRNSASSDPDPNVLGPLSTRAPGLYREAKFREGFKHLAPRNLSFEVWCLEPQLPEATELARAFPNTKIVLDHVGTPLGIGAYAGQREERFAVWGDNIRELAKSENVFCKLGGLAMPFCGFPSFMSATPASSEQLAREWRPYIETCIEAFGAERCMFESNFPVDALTCDYATLWNAFKRLAAGASADERTALFSGAAKSFYRV
jgi:L-fuconolactonase